MSTYIEREALISDIQAAVDNGGMGGMVAGALKRYVKRVPAADVVPVVRCKECKHRLEYTKMCMHPKAIGWDAIEPEDDDFCSYGERRNDQ